MILLASCFPSANAYGQALLKACGQRTIIASSVKEFNAALRENEYSLIVVDQLFAEANPRSTDLIWRHGKGAIPVFINLAISGRDRVVADCRAALERRGRERAIALKQASESLRSELTGSVTGILLSSELALSEPSLPETLRSRLKSLHDMAVEMRNRLNSLSSAT